MIPRLAVEADIALVLAILAACLFLVVCISLRVRTHL